ncbi:MAG: DNA polymerase III subunit delta' [Anaerolineae bacterium]|nr:DNA polymerase III subunit delta' [Anaerolineae bacterium]
MNETGWDIVGHEWAVGLLQRAVARDELFHAYLFTGPPGVGKSTLALTLARVLFCAGESRPCGNCQPCRLVASGNHPDLHFLSPESRSGQMTIGQIRDLQRQLALTPNMGRRRVAILEGFERANPSAANALLKTLEEPPPYAVLILLSPDSDVLLPTVVSRCQVISLRPLPASLIRRALEERHGVDPERARLLAHLSGGRMGWAVRAVQDSTLLQRRQRRLEELSALLQAPLVERFRYAAQMARDTELAGEVLDVWASWWRDVMLLAGGAKGPLTNPDRGEELEKLAARLGPRAASALVDATQAAGECLRRNVNPRLALEVLLAFDLPRIS